MSDLSVFVDESGTQEGMTEYYVVTYVLHNQSDDIAWRIGLYEEALDRKGLLNTPFHATPLMRAHDAYANLGMSHRKYLLMSFNMLVQKLRYATVRSSTGVASSETLSGFSRLFGATSPRCWWTTSRTSRVSTT